MIPNRFAWTSYCLAISFSFGVAKADDDVAFVAAVERFGRYDDISEIQTGRLLITELACTRCHASDDAMLAPNDAPNLSGVGRRLNESWIRDYVLNPSKVHPGTTMPDVLTGQTRAMKQQLADDLAAYLAFEQQPFPEIKASGANPVPYEFWKRGRADVGETLYHSIGCVACHAPSQSAHEPSSQTSALDQMLETFDEDELEALGLASLTRPVPSIPQPNLAAKYTVEGLTHFLLNPDRYHPGGRMPNFGLAPVEAADLASYLIKRDSAESSSPRDQGSTGNATAGQQAFESLGCATCHASTKTAPNGKPLRSLSKKPTSGCLQHAHTSGPAYQLDDFQRNTLVTAINATDSSVDTTEKLQQRLLTLNCYACHERGTLGGVGRDRDEHFQSIGNIDLGDEGRLPPPLTDVGRKIQPAWLKKILAGKQANIRPHMTIRMPHFPPSMTRDLPAWFRRADATKPKQAVASQSTPKTIEAGRQLMDLGCIQCHAVGGFTLPGVVGVDLSGVTERVNEEWFHAFLLDPASLKKRTRMPSFFADGQVQDTTLLDGDPQRQIAAMWTYLKDIPRHGLPEKIETSRSENYELVPTNRAILMRTFMPHVGTHAIAVGTPAGTHYGYDAERGRLTLAWRNRFLDAQGTWFVRFAPPAKPLGDATMMLQTGPTFLTNQIDPVALRFDGYRLSPDGVPTFLSSVDGLKIEDRTFALPDSTLRRTWRLDPGDDASIELAFSPLQGQGLKSIDAAAFVVDRGLRVRVSSVPAGASPSVVKINDEQRVVYSLNINERTELEILYSW